MKIQEIYDYYQIMPNLQIHQLQVAGVAVYIAKTITEDVNLEAVSLAALLHDMGNILKSDFSLAQELLEERGLDHWQQVKDDFHAFYGADVHAATTQIAAELGLGQQIVHLIDRIGFSHAQENVADSAYEPKILAYSDMRVSPEGVVPLEERFEDLRARYAHKYAGSEQEERRRHFEDAIKTLEKQLDTSSSKSIPTITDLDVAGIIDDLRSTEIDISPDQLPNWRKSSE